jgi:hypothetical protein
VHELMALRERPHLLARYEDVVKDSGLRQRIVEYAGLESAAGTRENLEAAGFIRQWELAKHGGTVTAKSVGRYASEPPGPVKALAERIWRLLPEYSEAFGFEVPPPETWIRGHEFQRQPGSDANPIDYPKSESALWPGPTKLEPSFQLRHARLALAKRLPEGAVAIDFACGTPALSAMLPPGRRHIPVDMAERGQGYRVAPLHEGKFPKVPGATLLLAFDVLEFLDADLPRLMRRLRAYNLPILATYHATDDSEGVDRGALGWVNHLSRGQLVAAFRKAGFLVKANWTADGPQSFFHLRPISVAAPELPPAPQVD